MATSFFVILILLVYIGYKQDIVKKTDIPVDYEQAGLHEQIVIRFSHVVAENTPKGLAVSKFAELVEKKTNGKIKVEIYPNSMLYSDSEEMNALQHGDIQMIAPSISNVTEMIPEWQVLDLPYLFNSYDDIHKFFTGDVSKKLLDMLENENIKGLALWSNGFKHMTSNNRPLIKPEDFKNVHIRTMSSQMLQEQYQLLQAKPVDVSFDQVYSSLEKHQIEAGENTSSNIYSKGFYKVQQYMTLSYHGFLGYAVMMNEDFWNSLSKELQNQLIETLNETTLWNLKVSEQMNKDSLEKILQNSDINIITLTDKQKEAWTKKWSPLYSHYQTEINSHLIKDIQKELK
nr:MULTISPECIES: DctP family TRAP transporter solute-binding subunit [Bacillus]